MDNRIEFADGRMEIEADVLTFNKVDRHHRGIYECLADNGYGKVNFGFLFCHRIYYENTLFIFNY